VNCHTGATTSVKLNRDGDFSEETPFVAEVTIRCRPNGPLVIEGPVTVVDAAGNPFPLPTHKPLVALCRCGQSANKPFCDGSHKDCGFQAEERAAPAAE
jgi:CDGSH-type Zn-finger protein